jgi:uncharacterized protein with NRDE domain
MCTVTWRHGDDGFELHFNRDELHARGKALPPLIELSEGVGWIGPRDSDFGGTWISVNAHGLCLGLLNGFREPADSRRDDFRSRGLLVRDLAPAVSLADVDTRLAASDLDSYRTFRLLALAPGFPARVSEWDGNRLRTCADAEHLRPVISSAFATSRVGKLRREEYARLTADGTRITSKTLAVYHRSHENGPSANSVCMHRDDAGTQSYARVRVTARHVELLYHPSAPCQRAEDMVLRLPRARPPSRGSR